MHGDQQRQKQVRRLKPEMNECAVEQVCTMYMVQDVDDQNC